MSPSESLTAISPSHMFKIQDDDDCIIIKEISPSGSAPGMSGADSFLHDYSTLGLIEASNTFHDMPVQSKKVEAKKCNGCGRKWTMTNEERFDAIVECLKDSTKTLMSDLIALERRVRIIDLNIGKLERIRLLL